MFEIILVSILVVVLLCALFLLHRNNWVYKQKGVHGKTVYNYRVELIKAGKWKTYHQDSYDDLSNSIMGYDSMVYRFWLWKFLDNFIIDKKRAQKLYHREF